MMSAPTPDMGEPTSVKGQTRTSKVAARMPSGKNK
jgi:hypothetical protein